MLNEQRVSFLKQSGIGVSTKVSRSHYPNTILDSDMGLLWETFINSPAFKSFSSSWTSDTIQYNYNAIMCWYSFLLNNHYQTKVDFLSAYKKDMQTSIKSYIRKSLSNLKMYKILPLMKVADVSYQLYLPSKTMEATRINCYPGASIKILIQYVPQRSKVIDLKVLDGPKLKKASVDLLLDRMQGYLFREKSEYLKYHKPLSAEKLMKIPSYQWYLKDGLRFRNNGSSLVLSLTYEYTGAVPISDAPQLLKEIDKLMSPALRSL